MNRWYLALFICAAVFAEMTMASSNEFHIRAKRQDCKCVRNPGGGLTCSCAKPSVSAGSTLVHAEQEQQVELAHELQTIQPQQNQAQARCACLQIVFQGNPQYQCQCGDGNGNPLPTSTLPTTTTTTPAPTTTTTQVPTTNAQAPSQGPGQCQCIMIRISGPTQAHYQCACQNTPKPVTMAPFVTTTTDIPTPAPETLPPVAVTLPATLPTPSPEPVYPPVGTINSTEEGCYCVDQMTANIQPLCGCTCNCYTMLCNIPSGVCACPQDAYGQPSVIPAAAEPQTTTPAIQYMPIEETTTLPPITLPPFVETTTLPAFQQEPAQQYPMTTTCVYVGVQASPCVCLPQYDQCAQNICCLKAKYRSYKNTPKMADAPQGESTIDMLMNVLHKLKTKLNH